MMASDNLVCKKEECTFAQTSVCVLDNDPTTCPNRISVSAVEALLAKFETENEPRADGKRRFTSSFTFTPEQTEQYMAQQYCKVVGILGVPGTGKTACLISMYLLLAHGALKRFQFLNSKTLMAFEEISSGARQWKKTDMPAMLTAHTEILDERSAGFLHLSLYSAKANANVQLLLPDIPGEWTTSFITKGITDRLDFLKAAECIWIFVNNGTIVSTTTRNATVHKLTLLIQRASSMLGSQKTRLVLVPTHIDQFPLNEELLIKVTECAKEHGFEMKIIGVASFSSGNPPPGSGVEDLFDDLIIGDKIAEPSFWQNSDIQPSREILKFGIKEHEWKQNL